MDSTFILSDSILTSNYLEQRDRSGEMGQVLGTSKHSGVLSGKTWFGTSSLKDRCNAPDLIPDDIFYLNFDCTSVSKKPCGKDMDIALKDKRA